MVVLALDKLSPLEFLRRNRGIRQQEVEGVLNLSRGAVSRIERGYFVPDDLLKARLAAYFEIDAEDLFPN